MVSTDLPIATVIRTRTRRVRSVRLEGPSPAKAVKESAHRAQIGLSAVDTIGGRFRRGSWSFGRGKRICIAVWGMRDCPSEYS